MSRVLILVDNLCGPFYYKVGLANALRYCGHEVEFWRTDVPNKEPLFDVFHRVKPDIFYSNTYDVDNDTIKVMARHPECKLILFGSAFGEANKVIGPEYQIVRVNDKEKKMVDRLCKEAKRPDLVFIHHHKNKADWTLGGWTSEFGIPNLGVGNAADVFTYFEGQKLDHLRSDCAAVMGKWGYKSLNIDRFIVPLLNPNRVPKLNVKIWGNQGWHGFPQYLGMCTDQTANNAFASAKICPSCSEPHSTSFGVDPVERPFKTISSGGFCISDKVTTFAEDFFPDNELPMGDTPEEYSDLVDYYLTHDDEREGLRGRQFKRVVAEHTYLDRIIDLFTSLGMNDETKHCKLCKSHWMKENGESK